MSDRLKLLILSDLHLVPEGGLSQGLDTAERLRQGVAAINAEHADADHVVLAGDLADQGEPEAYARLKEILADLKVPATLTIGNHDDRATFLAEMGAEHAAETGYVDRALDVKGHRVIVLDSVAPEGAGGHLAPEQLAWLGARLDEAVDLPVIVVVHHHANPLGTHVDRIMLENGAAFLEVLERHPDIRQVIAGHVHYTSTALWHGIPFTTMAGSHYSVTVPEAGSAIPVSRLYGPAQMAVVYSDADQTLVHFHNYLDGNAVLSQTRPRPAA